MILYSCLLSLILQTGSQDEGLTEFFKETWSPYCKGISLLECPSGKAEELRDEVRARKARGESLESIRTDLNQRYGDKGSLRMTPNAGGRENLSYSLPWMFFGLVILALGALIWWHRKREGDFVQEIEKKLEPSSQAHRNKVLKDLEEKIHS